MIQRIVTEVGIRSLWDIMLFRRNKKIFFGVLCFALILLVYFLSQNRVSSYKNQTLIYKDNNLLVYYSNKRYSVLFTDGNCVIKKAVYSHNREIIHSKGLQPIEEQDYSRYVGLGYEDIEAQLGVFHYDYGSGLFYPSYITQNGYMIVFSFVDPQSGIYNESTIGGVITIDLMTGEIRQ